MWGSARCTPRKKKSHTTFLVESMFVVLVALRYCFLLPFLFFRCFVVIIMIFFFFSLKRSETERLSHDQSCRPCNFSESSDRKSIKSSHSRRERGKKTIHKWQRVERLRNIYERNGDSLYSHPFRRCEKSWIEWNTIVLWFSTTINVSKSVRRWGFFPHVTDARQSNGWNSFYLRRPTSRAVTLVLYPT